MDGGVVGNETLLSGVVEVCTVINRGLFGGGATEDLWAPGVEVGVEVEDSDGAVRSRDAA